ncbi:MAG: dipeptide ABC transporter ATP-binding protein [Alphaproteobacteria bacterium]|nr:dipeptide ABC transporter ATP-binding protein [Alphaproteobacteria bacterium]
MTTPVLECKNVSISYYTRAGEVPAVYDFNLTVNPGEAVGIVGESGCGKSTVALAIMQYMGKNGAVTGGEIRFMGRDMRTMSAEELRDIRGSKIAMVYQEPMASLNPSMLIKDQLNEVTMFHEGLDVATATRRSMEMLEAVQLPDPRRTMESYPHQISGGQQQRVVIAMALLSNPQLLLLDEPTTALDVTVEAGVVELIKDIARRFGTSMIYISHNLGLILETCDRICVMYSGQSVEVGSVKQVFDEMRHPYTRGLFASIPLPGTDRFSHPLVAIPGQLPLPRERPAGCTFGPRCDFLQENLCGPPQHMEAVRGDEGHFVRCARYASIDWDAHRPKGVESEPLQPGKTVLQIRDMKKYYEVSDNSIAALVSGGNVRSVKANEKIDFVAHEAETVAIVGESGCGKSTLAKVLMGLEQATDGEVIVNGVDVAKMPVKQRPPGLVSSLQMVFQNPFETLNPSHSVGAQIGRVLRKFGVASTPDEVQRKTFELLDLVKLPREFANRKPRQLSGGQKQRIGIARAFGGNASVVVADEPVSALDVSVQAAVTGLLTDIQREKRTTMVFISHDLSVVRYLADRIVVMYLGRIMEQGSTDQVFAPPYHPYTEALLSAVPIADTSVTKKHIVLKGDLPSPMNPPQGCPFQTRCPRKFGAICETELPPVQTLAPGHTIMCHLSVEELKAMEPVFEIRPRRRRSPAMDVPAKPRTDATEVKQVASPSTAPANTPKASATPRKAAPKTKSAETVTAEAPRPKKAAAHKTSGRKVPAGKSSTRKAPRKKT